MVGNSRIIRGEEKVREW